jgi:hypothetical protein
VDSSGEYDTTNSKYSKWQDVGYCDDSSIRCWMDTDSVREVIRDEGLERGVLNNIDRSRIDSKGFWTYEKSRGTGDFAEDRIRDLIVNEEDDRVSIEIKIRDIEKILRDLTDFGITNTHRARGHYLLGRLYTFIAEELWKKRIRGEAIGSEFSVYAPSRSSDEDFTFERYLEGYGVVEDEGGGSFSENVGIGNPELDPRESVDFEDEFNKGIDEVIENEGGGSFGVPRGIDGSSEEEVDSGQLGRSRIRTRYSSQSLDIYISEGSKPVKTKYFFNTGSKNDDGSVKYKIYRLDRKGVLGFGRKISRVGEIRNKRVVFDNLKNEESDKHTLALGGLEYDPMDKYFYK